MCMDGLFLFSFLLSFGDRVWIFSSKTIKLIQIIYYDADEEDDEENDDDEEDGDGEDEDVVVIVDGLIDQLVGITEELIDLFHWIHEIKHIK